MTVTLGKGVMRRFEKENFGISSTKFLALVKYDVTSLFLFLRQQLSKTELTFADLALKTC